MRKRISLGVLLAAIVMSVLLVKAWSSDITDRFQWDGQEIALITDDGQCHVRFGVDDQKLNTGLPGPCRFVRKGTESVQYETYDDVGAVFIMVGPPASDINYEDYRGISADSACSRYSRGLIVNEDGRIELSKECYRGTGIHCPNIPLDEKEFYSFAYHEDPSLLCD